MSDIFETDIDNENENLSSLEDTDITESASENLVFDYPLYHLKLDYSCETLYAKTPDNKMQVNAGDLSEDELSKDVLRYYGIVKNIEIIGEAARMLSDEFKSSHSEVQWRNISGMRNFLVHEYFNVDEETIFEVLHTEIPHLKEQIIKCISTTN